jgi:hypothetical protein
LVFASAVAFFGSYDTGASLMGSFARFSFEAKVTKNVGFFCTLGSSSAASSLDSDRPGLRQTNPQKRGKKENSTVQRVAIRNYGSESSMSNKEGGGFEEDG